MEVYIPIVGILQFLLVYVILGLVLLVPLVIWENSFVTPNRKPFHDFSWRTLRHAVFISAFFWPGILYGCIDAQRSRNKR